MQVRVPYPQAPRRLVLVFGSRVPLCQPSPTKLCRAALRPTTEERLRDHLWFGARCSEHLAQGVKLAKPHRIICSRCEALTPRRGTIFALGKAICKACAFGRKPRRALDLYCGGGGAALGLLRAGFDEVIGIDIDPRNRAVYPGRFICGNALDIELVRSVGEIDFAWASPPCQAFSSAGWAVGLKDHPNLIPETRELLEGYAYSCIENVPSAPIRKDLILTGPMVGLTRIERQRHFELSFQMLQPTIQRVPRSMWESGRAVTITTSMCASSHYYRRKKAGLPGRVPNWEALEVMGIDRPMTNRQIGEAVAPAMAEFIGREVLRRLA